MPLIIDIGNTRTKLAWFAGGTLREQWSRERWGVTDLEEWRQKYDYQRVILAAVGALPEGVEAQLIDARGTVVQNVQLQDRVSQIGVSQYPAGVYFLLLKSENSFAKNILVIQ